MHKSTSIWRTESSAIARGCDGYLSRNQPTVNFGLGASDNVTRVVVTWPTGEQQVYSDLEVDQYLLLIENDSEAFTQRFEVAN